jgi:membrane-associated phospholipid phosphatase
MFSEMEGGQVSKRDVEIPGAALTIGGGLVAGSFLLGDDPARFQHAKGLVESLAVSGFFAVTVKRLVGRQRPDYVASNPTDDGRRSFPSGHTTRAVTTIMYTALYLRYHGFDQWREPGTMPWWEVGTYAGLGALAVGFGGERVLHNRHHLTDVLAGGALGAATSTLFFIYNERKFRKGQRPAAETDLGGLELRPLADESAGQVTLPAFDGPMMSFTGSF